jgi:hypothetical protein
MKILSTAWTVAVSVLAVAPLLPAQAPDRRPSIRIDIGSTSGPPETRVAVPITFTPGEGASIRRLRLTVRARGDGATFEALEPADVAKRENLQVVLHEATSSGTGRGQTSTLTMVVSLPPDSRGIPSGVLVLLNFRTNDGAEGATVYLTAAVEGTPVGSNQILPPHAVQTNEGTIDVLIPGNISVPALQLP